MESIVKILSIFRADSFRKQRILVMALMIQKKMNFEVIGDNSDYFTLKTYPADSQRKSRYQKTCFTAKAKKG